jgi:protein SCO1/2
MKTFCWFCLVIAIAISAATAGCNRNATTENRNTAAEKLYDVKGKVIALDQKKPSVTLDHEDIPGLMKAMTMEFSVADARALEGISVGDNVQGQFRKDSSGYVITRLEKR